MADRKILHSFDTVKAEPEYIPRISYVNEAVKLIAEHNAFEMKDGKLTVNRDMLPADMFLILNATVKCVENILHTNDEEGTPLDYEGDGVDENGEIIYDTAICRNCERKFENDYEEHYKYCPSCGTKLNWNYTVD